MADKDEIDWEDARTYLAVSRAGSLAGAARSLDVHHSTVFRRLERLEQRLGTPLFEREGGHYRPTAAGEAFEAHATRVEDELFALQRAVLGSDLMPSGTLRLTTLESLLPWVMPALAALQARCPDLRVELDATTETRALDRRDADMALRPSEAPPESAVGRRVAPMAWAMFAPCTCKGAELGRIAYVGPVAGFGSPQLAESAVSAGDGPPVMRARTVSAMAAAIAHGFGVGPLPCYTGDSDPRLRRFGPARAAEHSALWLLLHPDLRHSARIRAVIDLLVPSLEPHVALFAGRAPRTDAAGSSH